jgi:hypothetical protein
MAIKPNDCVIKIKDLVVGFSTSKDMFGHPEEVPVYKSYWTNFLTHVKETTEWRSAHDAYEKNLNRQLAKFNGTYKRTKNWNDHYVKFKSQSDFTFFVLRWS